MNNIQQDFLFVVGMAIVMTIAIVFLITIVSLLPLLI